MANPDPAQVNISQAGYKEEYQTFLGQYPEYLKTMHLDELRSREFPRLSRSGSIYLDYTGSSLYADSQLNDHLALLRRNVFGNPHSLNPTSLAMTELVESTRESILRYFHASEDEYAAIFTLNATAALKLVGESFPFSSESAYLLTFDNHNSVNGIREFARKRGARIIYAPITLPGMQIDKARLLETLGSAKTNVPNLFVYPAQSNFSGIQHSLDWIKIAQDNGWTVLLDAAAYVPTNTLNLERYHPDFISVSFYKMFGYPTGVGCLLARRSALEKLQRPWFAGGTISIASVQGDKFYLAEGEQGFEDGTLNFLSIPAVGIGLRLLQSIGIGSIHSRVKCLTDWLIAKLSELRYSNGSPLIKIYGSTSMEERGGVVTMNYFTKDGNLIDHITIEQKANKHRISLRTGCFCNPGGIEIAMGLSKSELVTCLDQMRVHPSMEDFRQCVSGKGTGAVRVSTGIVSNFDDVAGYLNFSKIFLE